MGRSWNSSELTLLKKVRIISLNLIQMEGMMTRRALKDPQVWLARPGEWIVAELPG